MHRPPTEAIDSLMPSHRQLSVPFPVGMPDRWDRRGARGGLPPLRASHDRREWSSPRASWRS